MAKKESGIVLPTLQSPAYEARMMSTTDGRQRLPDVLQRIYGEKGIVGFERYGRVIAVAVPLEAIRMLADDAVDAGTQERIRKAAQNLIQSLNQEKEE